MLIIYNETRQRFEAQYDWAEHSTAYPLLKSSGFSFDGDVYPKVWHSQNYFPKYGKKPRTWAEQIAVLVKVWPYVDSAAKGLIANNSEWNLAAISAMEKELKKQESFIESAAMDAKIDIPHPEGLEYLPFQKAGISYAIKHENTLIADEMGLGKTIQAIGVSNVFKAKRALVVCKSKVKLNWMRETIKWDVLKRTVAVLTDPTREAKHMVEKYGEGRVQIISKEGPFTADIVIINFDMVAKCADALRSQPWDLFVVDEIQMVMNLKAQRTYFLYGRKESKNKKTKEIIPAVEPIVAKRNIFMTGTPILNRTKELWPIIQRFDPDGLGANFFKYALRYCDAKQNEAGYWDFNGASNLEELQTYLRSNFMVRRLKVDVMPELPPKRRSIRVLETDGLDDSILERENKKYEEFLASGLTHEEIPFTAMSKEREATALAKLPFVFEFLDDTLEEVEKVVVFAHHQSVIRKLIEKYGDAAVVVDGNTSDTAALAAQDRFQTDPTCRVFIGSILASGAGLTLTAAHTIVFAELDWVPGNNSQAEDRCHRIGQSNGLNIYYLVLDGSVDARVIELVLEKQAIIDKTLDAKIEPKPMPAVGAPAPNAVTLKSVTPVSEVKESEPKVSIDQATSQAIHKALQILAGVCDGAYTLDGAGFNKIDSDFGKKLARAFSLTPKQALAGQKLVRRYHRQLPADLLRAAGIELEDK